MEKEKIDNLWQHCVINSLAISKLIYVGSVSPIPDDILIKKILNVAFLISFGRNVTELNVIH